MINDKKVEVKLKPSGFYEYQVKGSQLGYGIHYYKWVATDAAGRQTTPVGDVIKIASNQIKVDQVGYRTNSKKIFFVTYSDTDNWMCEDEGTLPKSYAKKFKVVNAISKNVVYEGGLTNPQWDENSWDYVQEGDFTAVKTSGLYYISVEKIGDFVWFKIEDDVYSDTAKTLIRSYYLQRCGVYINDKLSGVYHKACHLFDALYFNREDAPSRLWDAGTSNKFNSDWTPAIGISQKVVPLGFLNGGWHDAGDYGKYIVNLGVSVGTLFDIYFLNKTKFKDNQLSLPYGESFNNIPDILDEIKYCIKWIFAMQNETTGGVYHKLTAKNFEPMNILPNEDYSERYIIDLSLNVSSSTPTSAASSNFVGMLAQAYRAFKNYDPEFAQKCLSAAEKAWEFLENNPTIVPQGGFRNPKGVSTGEYGDSNDTDERLWAAAELFSATSKQKYNDYFKTNYYKIN
jgi:endoglucanase